MKNTALVLLILFSAAPSAFAECCQDICGDSGNTAACSACMNECKRVNQVQGIDVSQMDPAQLAQMCARRKPGKDPKADDVCNRELANKRRKYGKAMNDLTGTAQASSEANSDYNDPTGAKTAASGGFDTKYKHQVLPIVDKSTPTDLSRDPASTPPHVKDMTPPLPPQQSTMTWTQTIENKAQDTYTGLKNWWNGTPSTGTYTNGSNTNNGQ